MLKLVSNKDGVETHTLHIENGIATVEPEFDGIAELLQGLTDKQQILNTLTQFNTEYVWAVTYESPPMPTLTRRQFRLTLAIHGYDLNAIESLIEQIEDPLQRTIAQVEWQDSTSFERTSPTLLTMANLLGLTPKEVDTLWEYALTL